MLFYKSIAMVRLRQSYTDHCVILVGFLDLQGQAPCQAYFAGPLGEFTSLREINFQFQRRFAINTGPRKRVQAEFRLRLGQ